jgi:hypothetical protein
VNTFYIRTGLVPVGQSGSEAGIPVAKVAMLSHYEFEQPSNKDNSDSPATSRATSVRRLPFIPVPSARRWFS